MSSTPRSVSSASARIASRGRRVEMLAGLVEDQQREAGELRASERDPAALAAREAMAARAGLARQVERRRAARARARRLELGLGRVAAGEQQVLAQRRVEHVRVLRDEPDGGADGVAVERAQLDAAERHRAFVVQESQQHRGEGRLAGAARADDRDLAARREVEVDAVRGRSRSP